MCNKLKPQKVIMSKNDTSVTCSVDWFLKRCSSGKSNVPEEHSIPVPATILPLINGKRAFTEVYERILKAEKSVDIAIWGFQPSMFFKRDGNSPCIGELLIKKVLENSDFKVRLLVYSMKFGVKHAQTFQEANLGNMPELTIWKQKCRVDGVDIEQMEYDRLWYEAIRGNIASETADYATLPQNKIIIMDNSYLRHFDAGLLRSLSQSNNRKNIQLKFRSVASQKNEYLDKTLPTAAKMILALFPTHHQKTVLIDYDDPNKAVGFVLEHNMVDNYWDTDEHSINVAENAKYGKNSPVPLQDVSSMVTGQVLWDINYNFSQSWQRKDSKLWNLELSKDEVDAENAYFNKRNQKERKDYIPNSDLGHCVVAQVLRTYDKPQVEDIKEMYLQNISQTTSYIYTENQYFRFPPLAEEFIKCWKKLVSAGRTPEQPIHWFVITNSSEEGLGKGTYTTNQMFKLLGRQDVMPGVATNLDKNLGNEADYKKYDEYDKKLTKLKEKLQKLEEKNERTNKDYEQVRQELDDLEKIRQDEIKSDWEKIKALQQQVGDVAGIKVHIATIVAKESWQEVYIHSKVTIIDDVFLCISSANLNTRSMQVDTELGIISECKEVTQKLRQDLWALHMKNNFKANLADLSSPVIASDLFDEWEKLMADNHKLRNQMKLPNQPLTEFLRLTTSTSRAD